MPINTPMLKYLYIPANSNWTRIPCMRVLRRVPPPSLLEYWLSVLLIAVTSSGEVLLIFPGEEGQKGRPRAMSMKRTFCRILSSVDPPREIEQPGTRRWWVCVRKGSQVWTRGFSPPGAYSGRTSQQRLIPIWLPRQEHPGGAQHAEQVRTGRTGGTHSESCENALIASYLVHFDVELALGLFRVILGVCHSGLVSLARDFNGYISSRQSQGETSGGARPHMRRVVGERRGRCQIAGNLCTTS